ncbi:MAG: aldo/keto reductase [Tannerellaceae bacterium]|nr:aldo/keto reductase [Tannerellaceae bacterium]
MKITRRQLFRMSAAGAGTLLVPSVLRAGNNKEAVSEIEQTLQMPERILGCTGMKLPVLSMGVNRADNPNVLRAAYNAGIFHFDTGYAYQNGNSEEMIGTILGDKPRETLNIATKAMFDYPLKDNFEEVLFNHLDTSLKRMKLDYVDIFYAHSISSVEKLTDPRVLAALQKIKASGKARFIGFSSHDQKNELLDVAVGTGVYDVAMVTYNFKIENLAETEATIERAAKAGMGIIAMKVMAGGTEDGEGKKKINGKACLKWVWENPHITTVLPSVANFDELDSCFEAVQELTLSPEEKEYLLAVKEEGPSFCRQCGKCRQQCPAALPVPDMMRAYMYAYGYKYARLSKEALLQAGLSPSTCADCKECTIQCPSGLDVGNRIAAIMPVMNVQDELLT